MNQLPFEKVSRRILVKKEVTTSDKFGTPPDKRTVEQLLDLGIVNVDKPGGPTSHQVSAYVKQLLKLTKAGHSGTLDPNVTGVLPVALGKSTKITQALLTAGKEYICIMHLHDEVPEAQIRKICEDFVGSIKQLPPLKSAVKRQERYRKVYYLEILEIDRRDVLFRVGCEAGTYIRKLCTDIGKALKTNAHMAELRRTKAGPFTEATAVTLQDLHDAYAYWKEENDEKEIRKCIQPVENAVLHLPKIWVFDTTVESLCHGAALHVPGVAKLESQAQANGLCAIMTLKNELVALGTLRMSSKRIFEESRGMAATIDAVFIEEGTYPKILKK